MVLNIYVSRLFPWSASMVWSAAWSVALIGSGLSVTQHYSSLNLSYSCLLKANHDFEYVCF